jgi:hypothetical protein
MVLSLGSSLLHITVSFFRLPGTSNPPLLLLIYTFTHRLSKQDRPELQTEGNYSSIHIILYDIVKKI